MKRAATFVTMCILLSANALAEPTTITVRVISKDAKFIGSSMGGASVVLRDADTGEVLAQGLTQGSTGDTTRIMRQPRERERALSTENAAKFVASIDIDEPVHLEVVARGPLSNPDSANTVSATQWIFPGKHIREGDGWLLEISGFSVNATTEITPAPDTHAAARLTIVAHVTMMCGCPIEPDGLWDANRLEVAVHLSDGDGDTTKSPLRYAGKTSTFSASMDLPNYGPYRATIYAYDHFNGNTGVDVIHFNGPE